MQKSFCKLIHSFNNSNSKPKIDYCQYLDENVANIIKKRPDLDFSSIGLTGIGQYLCYRYNSLQASRNKESLNLIKENLQFYVDWVANILLKEKNNSTANLATENYMFSVFESLENFSFLSKRVKSLRTMLGMFGTPNDPTSIPSNVQIVSNTLKICNLYN